MVMTERHFLSYHRTEADALSLSPLSVITMTTNKNNIKSTWYWGFFSFVYGKTNWLQLSNSAEDSSLASHTMGTGSFPGVKQPGRGADHPPPFSAKVKERVELYLYSPSGPLWPVLGWTLPLKIQYSSLWYSIPNVNIHNFLYFNQLLNVMLLLLLQCT